MAGIAACDFFNMGSIVYDRVLEVLQENECWNSHNYNFQLFSTWKMSIFDVLRRENSYLGVLMALVRYSVIKYSMEAKFEYISKPIFGIFVFMVTFFCSSLVSGFYFYHFYLLETFEWSPPEQCRGYPANYTQMYYMPVITKEFFRRPWLGLQSFMFVDGLIKIFPTILLPILTLLLIAEIRAAKRIRMKLSSNVEKWFFLVRHYSIIKFYRSQPDHTTKLVTVMTVAVAKDPPLGTPLLGYQSQSDGPLWFSPQN
ncbi:hypothetical protein CRE_13008 [Caenorhabditis remanei]|uniref:G-protein coupled receptors family 1 profile domain-containing protein n=1 Tax=Caenorhabditis remanei TaxID=31234 RepID=E3N175_CAERE|nr:hypothetical protein CRE_13008 [Caenorhabditis remanei]